MNDKETKLAKTRADAANAEANALRAWDRSDPVHEGAIQRTMADRKLSRADAIGYLRGLNEGRGTKRGDSSAYRTDDK
jgi:hypothetical protein